MLPGLIVLAAVPAVVFGAYRVAISSRLVAPYRADRTVHRTIVVGAMLLGFGLVLSDPELRANLSPGRLVDEAGIWAMDWHSFLWDRADPVGHVVRFLHRDTPVRGFVTVFLATGLSLIGTALVLVFTRFGRREAIGAAILLMFVVIVVVGLTLYLTMLAAYLAHILNFWVFILWIVVVQYFRKEKHAEKLVPHG